ncbi:MAG TPA: aldo/keto reductase [Streptosporangiaceae bacterium]|nr:aldo/keto reductase [Streptosporangiaceae bacterium]
MDMRYRRLGDSGLVVSVVGIGCNNFGRKMDESETRLVVDAAIDHGINLFDTADIYGVGASETLLGKALQGRRDDVVIATKFGMDMQGENGIDHGARGARRYIVRAAEASLRRLGTDYIDLYQIHRYDSATPIEETMEALNDLVRAGKVRYIGASSMWTWQFVQAQHIADANGWTRFVSMQDQYNLLMREEEREMHPYCLDEGIGVIPWSPLARGRLTRDWDTTTARSETDEFGQNLYLPEDQQVHEQVAEVASARGIPRAQVAMAWLLGRPGVTAPIVGVTRASHLDDAVAALDVELTRQETEQLEKPYVPHRIAGHI